MKTCVLWGRSFRSFRLSILFLLTLLLLATGCAGIHVIPLLEGESVQLEFDGPIHISYFLADGTEQTLTVEDQLELVLVNHFDDGDPAISTAGENLFTYFRLNVDGGDLYLGKDPAALNPVNGDPLFTPTAIADYDLAAQFEFEGQPGGLLKNSEPVHVVGNFLGATAYRYEFRCVNAMGETVFVYDVQVFRLCTGVNHVEHSAELFPHAYSREEIVGWTPGNSRNLLATQMMGSLADRPPLVLKFVNTSFDPDSADGGADGADGLAEGFGDLGDGASGGCAFHPRAHRSGRPFNGAALWLIPLLLLPRILISRADRRGISNE